MNLTSHLRSQNYDLIDGPVRNHKTLQLWLKRGLDNIDFYSSDINKVFSSNMPIEEIDDPAMSVTSTRKDEYKFNAGVTILEEILKSIGLGAFEISSTIKTGKKVSISYDNSTTRIVPTGDITAYFSRADFKDVNPALLKDANRENLHVITGIVFAKNLVVEIETDFDLNAEIVATLNQIADGKLDFSISSQKELKMVSSGSSPFPIAVKAHKIVFDKGQYRNLVLVTDTRNYF